jgi:sulfonate transport system substrate-binding protein
MHANLTPHRFVRRTVAAVVALTLAAGLAACGDDSEASTGAEVLKVGQLGSVDTISTLFELAGEDDHDYTIESPLFAAGGPALLEAVPSGSVDVALMADTPTIFATVQSQPLKVVSVGSTMKEGESVVQLYAAQDSGITDVKGLKGKKVATTEATILQYTLVRALEQAGLSLDDVEVVNLAPADAIAAFGSGDIDALTALEVQSAQLSVSPDAVQIGDGAGLTSGHFYISATDDALADEAQAANVEDFVARYARARQWADEHPDEWAAAVAELNGFDVSVAEALLARQDYEPVAIDDAVVAQLQEQADTYTELGLLPNHVDVSGSFDDRFNHLVEEGQ